MPVLKQHPLSVGIGDTQAAVINHLRRKGAASRAEIAEFCGVTPAAVSMMVRDLIKRGIIIEGARRHGGRGAPHIDLMLQSNVGYALGVHANHYSLTLTLLDFCGKRIGEHRLEGPYKTFYDIQTTIDGVKTSLLASCDVDESLLLGAGIAMPTRFRHGATGLDLAEEVISWAGSDLASSLNAKLGCAVLIENDANAAAMGELALGNAAEHDNFAYLYLSEGIGSGIIIDKELYRGSLGNAGEVGALRSRGLSRPSFEDLADWCNEHVGYIPKGRSCEQWAVYLEDNMTVLNAWLERAGPQTARLAFMIAAVLAPSAIFIGGTLPRLVRERLAQWLDFDWSKPFEGGRVLQPTILIPEIAAADTVAFGAAAMILHNLPNSS
nr:ROK family transcriptional regulator [Agrobacterium sp. rho-13.3]MDX8306169.1 ROK family transcriptional regulator [Agrobacterium sp. rho-13.3]MDX8307500.1 ROK family transcriptional regulator [Agrobacterium sp. rho-13.3]